MDMVIGARVWYNIFLALFSTAAFLCISEPQKPLSLNDNSGIIGN
jgi:hypothetical protein